MSIAGMISISWQHRKRPWAHLFVGVLCVSTSEIQGRDKWKNRRVLTGNLSDR